MLRNGEIKILLTLMGGISALAICLTIFFPQLAPYIVSILSIFLISATFLFTHWRYREIRKLSAYLRKISGGDFSLDVRDNREGELSILKNNIYKVTLMLSEQSSVLQRDKSKLIEAISDISHQLKTPVTSMIVMADLLDRPELPAEKRREFTGNIRTQLERIEWLVSSLLKLSKIDAGSIQFKADSVAVKKLIHTSLEPLLIPAELKQQSIIIAGKEDVTYTGDFNWSSEALINIFKNCVEHTPEGGRLTIDFSENALYTEIRIADNGKGIAREDLPYIFQRFYKGKNAGDDSVGYRTGISRENYYRPAREY